MKIVNFMPSNELQAFFQIGLTGTRTGGLSCVQTNRPIFPFLIIMRQSIFLHATGQSNAIAPEKINIDKYAENLAGFTEFCELFFSRWLNLSKNVDQHILFHSVTSIPGYWGSKIAKYPSLIGLLVQLYLADSRTSMCLFKVWGL